nr:hypothetical protein [Tanacetum cinerariifolium]
MESFQGLTTKSPSSWHRSLASDLFFYDHVTFHLKCKIDSVVGSKLRNKNADESKEIIKNIYDHEGWNDIKEFAKHAAQRTHNQQNPKKVLMREEVKFPVTKNVNSISLARGKYERSDKIDVATGNDIEKPIETETGMQAKEAEKKNEAGKE